MAKIISTARKIIKSEAYETIRKDLLNQLELNGIYGEHYKNLVDDYMTMYVTKQMLKSDIQERGAVTEYDNGGGQKGKKKNDSIDQFNKTNSQMLNLLTKLGLDPERSIGKDCDGDEDDEDNKL